MCKIPPFPGKLSNAPQNCFYGFLRKYWFFWKNCRIKNIQHLISDKKGYILLWCKMTPDSRTVTQLFCWKESILPSKMSFFWRTSCHRYFVHFNISGMAIFGGPSSISEGDRHMRPWLFFTEFNAEQLLFKAFSHRMHIFGSIEPQTESTFPFLYITIFQRWQSFGHSSHS